MKPAGRPELLFASVLLLLLAVHLPVVAWAITQPASHDPAVSIVNGASTLTTTAFSPDTITVVVGVNGTVTWTNDDSIAHTVTSDSAAFDLGTIQPGKSASFTFTHAGTFSYHCTIHPNMVGKVIVLGSPGGTTATSTTGGSVPEFPLQALAVGLLSLAISASYIALRRLEGPR